MNPWVSRRYWLKMEEGLYLLSSFPRPGRRTMYYQITVRYGKKVKQYLSLTAEADNAPQALRLAAEGIPDDVADMVDIVELREAPDFDKTMARGEEEEEP